MVSAEGKGLRVLPGQQVQSCQHVLIQPFARLGGLTVMMVQPEQPKVEGKEDEYGKGTQCKREMSLKRRGRDGNVMGMKQRGEEK